MTPSQAPPLFATLEPTLSCDSSQRFVRVLQERAGGLVAFEFAIGWPELVVELLLPRPAFEAFCLSNQVQALPA